MSMIQTLLLGVLQGATEFLPVSSSGHLVVVPWLLGVPAPDLAFDALVHWATATALLIYFWREWIALTQAGWHALRARSLDDPGARLALLIILGTIPGAASGLLLEDFFESMFTRPHIASLLLLVTAGILAISERWARREQGAEELSWYGSLVVGLAQALAILPGISRSGATIAAGMGLGLRRESAARFSFLLATPITLGAGLLQTVSLAQSGSLTARAPALLVGFVAALLAGLVCIHFLLRYLQRHSLYPFALYCSLLGASGLLIYFLST